MPFLKELKRLGLKDKEAAVYLACLELGPSPVQQISRKANVVRATTYVVLDVLAERGLVAQYKEGKKTLFSAEPPRQLLRLIEKQEEVLREKKHDLEQLLPELQMIVKSTQDRPYVRYYAGKEGLRAIRSEIIMYCQPGDTIYNFTPTDHVYAVFSEPDDTFVKQRSAKRIKALTLFSAKNPNLRAQLLREHSQDRRYVPADKFPSSSGLTVFRDRVAIGSFSGHLGGVIIENNSIAETMKHLFMMAWDGAALFPK